MLADAWRRPVNSRRRAIKARRGFGLADGADIGMVKLDDEFARYYLLVGDHFIAAQHWCRRHIVGIKPMQPIRSRVLLDNLRH